MSMLTIGVTGLNAAQIGILTTQNNISNANTAGYSRQSTNQATNDSVSTGQGFIGQGVHVETIRRSYDQFTTGQINSSQTNASELTMYHDQISIIDNMLADPNSGLSPALQEFFHGVQQVAADPSSIPARQAMVSSTESLVSRIQGIDSRLTEQYADVNGRLKAATSEINSLASQVANLNQRISIARASTGHAPNSLLDQRDQLIVDLNKQIRITSSADGDNLNLFIGNGQQLVVGASANLLTTTPSIADPGRHTVALVNGLVAQELPDSVLTGGAVAGLIRFRSESLDKAANALGRITATLALTFNAQQALGQDLTGKIDGSAGFAADYFQISTPKLIAHGRNSGNATIDAQFSLAPLSYNSGNFKVVYDAGSGQYTATSGRYSGGPWVSNDLALLLDTVENSTGEPIDIQNGHFTTDITTSDYRVQFDATGNNYTITRLSDKQVVVPTTAVGSGPQFFDGLSVDVSTAGGTNDSFLIQPTREIAREVTLNAAISADPRLIAAAGPVRGESNATNAGNGKIKIRSIQPGYVQPATPLTLTYNSTSIPPSFSLAGATGATVSVTTGGAVTNYVNAPPAVIPYTTGAIISIDGINFAVSGEPKNGDVFTVGRNINGISDSSNALLLGKLQTESTTAGGTASYQSAYAQLVSDIGNRTREIQVTGEAQSSMLSQALTTRESQAGVNLDEEAANLIRYQQAYQASARVISVGAKLFDTLISIGL